MDLFQLFQKALTFSSSQAKALGRTICKYLQQHHCFSSSLSLNL